MACATGGGGVYSKQGALQMRVGFYGGVEGITGSCFLLEADNKKVLIDCRLFQGLEEHKNYEPFPFNPREMRLF